MYPWTFCIYGRFVDWTFCRGGRFVSMDVLYLWTFRRKEVLSRRTFCGRTFCGWTFRGRTFCGRTFCNSTVLAITLRYIFALSHNASTLWRKVIALA